MKYIYLYHYSSSKIFDLFENLYGSSKYYFLTSKAIKFDNNLIIPYLNYSCSSISNTFYCF